MAARKKRCPGWSEKDICSEDVGVRGLTYDETSVVYSLLWNQPGLHGTRRRANPLVRKGSTGDGVGLSLFYMESPDHPISEGDEGGSEGEDTGSKEIHEVHPSTVQRVQPWRLRKRRVVDNVPPTPEADIAGRVRSELGYMFPPVMCEMVENHIHSKWLKWRERGAVGGQNRNEEERKIYHQVVVDAQVFLAKEIERKLAPCDSDSQD